MPPGFHALWEAALNHVLDTVLSIPSLLLALEHAMLAVWLALLPGCAIMLSVLIVNIFGEGVRHAMVAAVQNVSFTLREDQTLAIIGENGSGKSTLAKMLAGSVEPSDGEILIDDHPLHFGDYRYRSQRIRMIFQYASNALNPRQRIGQLLEVPLRLNTTLTGGAANANGPSIPRCARLACGRITRITIRVCWRRGKNSTSVWRALILQPKVIVADEALASLYMLMRSQIINLMHARTTGEKKASRLFMSPNIWA